MASSGMPRGQIGGALDLHISKSVVAKNTTNSTAGSNSSTPGVVEIMKGKFVPLQWRLAINKKAPASGNAGDLFVGYGKREDLGSDATLDRPGSDNLLTPTRQLPTGQGNIDYDPTTGTQDGQGPDGKANPRNIIESIPEGTERVLSGHRFQKNIPLMLRFDGSIKLVAHTANTAYCGAVWPSIVVGTTTLVPRSASLVKLIALGGGAKDIIEISRDVSSVFSVPNNIDLDTNAGTDVTVNLNFALKSAFVTADVALLRAVLNEFASKGSLSTATSVGSGKFQIMTSASPDLDYSGLTVDISQVSSGIDQVN